jgi:hypothetical protein
MGSKGWPGNAANPAELTSMSEDANAALSSFSAVGLRHILPTHTIKILLNKATSLAPHCINPKQLVKKAARQL